MLSVLAICAAPFVLATLAFYFWQPAGRTNTGEILLPKLLAITATTSDGKAFDVQQFGGKWALAVVDTPVCGEACQQKLFAIRQLRTAQGRDQDRIERLWLLSAAGSPATGLEPLTAGVTIAHAATADAVATMFGSNADQNIYLIDPQGHLMMRFPARAEPKLILKDLRKLLSVNKRGT